MKLSALIHSQSFFMCIVTYVLCYIFLLYEYILISSDRSRQRVLNDLKRTRLSCRLIIWLKDTPPSPPLPSVSSTGETQEDGERETTCRRERGEGGGGGAQSYDGETLSSMNDSICFGSKESIDLFDLASMNFIIFKIDLVLPTSFFILSVDPSLCVYTLLSVQDA
jgi:hypothetical protein